MKLCASARGYAARLRASPKPGNPRKITPKLIAWPRRTIRRHLVESARAEHTDRRGDGFLPLAWKAWLAATSNPAKWAKECQLESGR